MTLLKKKQKQKILKRYSVGFLDMRNKINEIKISVDELNNWKTISILELVKWKIAMRTFQGAAYRYREGKWER